MKITIENLTIHYSGMPSMTSARISSMLNADEPAAPEIEQHAHGRPLIGQEWPGQGGIYAGDFRASDDSIYGLIVAHGQDIGRATWAPNGERDLSDWDGLANTKALRKECPAAKLAAEYTRDGHDDFYLPARRELLLGAANLHDSFGKKGWYWTSTPRAEHYAWAVDFEHGLTFRNDRSNEFRVRPFRRFIY